MVYKILSFIHRRKTKKSVFWTIIIAGLLLCSGQGHANSLNAEFSDVIISEFMAANGSGLADEDGDHSDWIELYNRSNQAVNLAGWSLTDNPDQPGKWFFPDMTLGSREYLVLFASGKNRTAIEPGAALHTNFKLSKSGGFLGLYSILEDKYMDMTSPQFPEQFRDVAYGRGEDMLTFGYLTTPTPGQANAATGIWAGAVSPVNFSVERGFYDTPFTVELSTDTTGAVIKYTLDGSKPTETNGTTYTDPITIDTTTLVSAVALTADFLPSPVKVQSYIFLDDVLTQPAVPPGVPAGGDTQTSANYGMNPEIVNDSRYKNAIKDSLQSLPVLSLVMGTQSFTDLYLNPEERGRSSEQPVSVEFMYPDSEQAGFQVNAGIRPYGNVAYGSLDSAKHTLRLFFRGDYGATKLEHPLFPDSPVEQFDTLVLQAAGNNNFGDVDSGEEQVDYARNEWVRASQVDLSGLGSHGRFVHLYINGLYWGLYNVAERPDAAFMAAYLGGEEQDWFVANQDGPLDDDLGSRTDTLNYLFTTLGFASRINSNPVQQEYLAETYSDVATYLDHAQFSDFVILNLYTEILDWPENNWYAAVGLNDLPGRGKFLVGDKYKTSYVQGEQTDAGTLGTRQVNIFKALFETLMENPDFRIQFADRLYKHLFDNGGLTDTKAQARWLYLNNTIEPAIITEAARWGNSDQDLPDQWLKIRDDVLAKMEGNSARLIAFAREAGYYPQLDPPLFSQKASLVEAGFSLDMALTPESAGGTIYYTTDGSDPRMSITGKISPRAAAYTNIPLVLTQNTSVKARVFDGQDWSALNEATFSVVEQDNKLRLTEIMYNPLGGDDYEFIELKNTGSSEVNLANVTLSDGIYFVFPSNTPPLAPGEFAVLVKNPEVFAGQHPDVPVHGTYDGSLSNKGETIILMDARGQVLLDITYDDRGDWPITPDGRGDSLVLVSPNGNPNSPQNWRASAALNGSPGGDEPGLK